MSSFVIKQDLLPPSSALDELFQAIGWRPRGAQKWTQVLSRSSCITSAWQDERLVGFARLLEDGVMCMVYDFGVLPNCQGQGIGTAMMQQLIEFVQGRGYASIGLWAWTQNPNNLPFYSKVGFIPEAGGMELKRLMNPE